MSERKESYAAVAFKRRGGTYQGSVPLKDLALLHDDPAQTMHAVTDIYQRALREIRQWQKDAESVRQSRVVLSARKAWELGDIVHRLNTDFAKHSCRLENLYDHLARHAGTSGWLSQYVTLRRYVNDVESIPESLTWNSIAKKVKPASQAIAAGLSPES